MQSKSLSSKSKYFYEISFIRALACLCIVMVHVSAGFYYENDKTFNWLTQFLNQISRYGTPAFAIISGFLLYNQALKRKFNVKKFWKSRFTKVISPFFIWSTIYLILKWSHGQFTLPNFNSIEDTKEFLYFFFTGKSNYHLYFIVIVVQFCLFFPLLEYFKSKKSLVLITLSAFFINFFFVNYTINFGSGYFNQFINEKVFIFHWVYYFFLGGLLVHFWEDILTWVKENEKTSLLLGLVTIIGGVFEYKFAGWIDSNRSINMIALPILFISLSALYNILSPWDKLRHSINEIGNLSMGIYLVHPFVLFFLRNYDFFSPLYERTRYLPFVYILTLISSIIIVKSINNLPLGSYIVTVAKPKKSKPPKIDTGLDEVSQTN